MYTIVNIRPLGYNIGNQAIHFALRYMLYESFGRLVSIIDYPATSVYENTAKAGLTAATVYEINRFADGVIIGGGNLYENDEITVDPRAIKALQPPLFLFSNSRGRIYNRYSQLAERSDTISDNKLKLLLSRADLSLSRDSATHRYLSKIDDQDCLGWCPTINVGRYIMHLPKLPENEEVGTLISIRTPNLMNIPYLFQSRIQSHIESAIDHLRSAGHKRIRILCNDSRDLDFATAFRYIKDVDSIYTNDVYQYLALLKSARMVISYRLHASLPSISFGTPTINIAYDERAQSLINDLDLQSASLNLVDLGNNFPQFLATAIDSGGYKLENYQLTKADWEAKSNFQFSKITEFKNMVEYYVRCGIRMGQQNCKD